MKSQPSYYKPTQYSLTEVLTKFRTGSQDLDINYVTSTAKKWSITRIPLTMCHLAALWQNQTFFRVCYEYFKYDWEIFHELISFRDIEGDYDRAQIASNLGFHYKYFPHLRWTVLDLACFFGNEEIAKYILNMNENITQLSHEDYKVWLDNDPHHVLYLF
jgi:hypothetical protein